MRAFRLAWLALPLLSLLLSPSPSAGQALERVIYAFSECGNSIAPLTADAHGNLYGTTLGGGAGGDGCILKLSPSADGWQENTLYSFSGPDGNGSAGALAGGVISNTVPSL